MASQITDEILFNGGLDTDSDEKAVVQGDYVDALNIYKVEDGEGGILVNIKGNENVYQYDTGYNQYLCGWSFYDKNESIILFIFAKLKVSPYIEKNIIVEYNPQTGGNDELVDDLALSFQNPSTNDYFIKADISGDWLSWTDNVNAPRMINIQTVKDDSPTITEAYLNLIKAPPLVTPIASFGNDPTIEGSNVADSLFKFKYRYTYVGYLKSVWSSATSANINMSDLSPFDVEEDYNIDNYLNIKFNSGSGDVLYIEFAMQNIDSGSWYKVINLDKDNAIHTYTTSFSPATTLGDDTLYYYRFYNDGQYPIIDINEINKPYDNVPLTSETLSFIGDDRLVVGGNTTGYDVDDIVIDIDFTPAYAAADVGASISGTFAYADVAGDLVGTVKYDLTAMLPAGAKAGDLIKFNFHYQILPIGFMTLNKLVYFSYDASTVLEKFNYIKARVGKIETDILSATPADSVDITLVGNDIVFTAQWDSTTGTSDAVLTNLTTYTVTNKKQKSFKSGVNKEFGIVYYDDYGRKSPILVGDNTFVAFDANNSVTGKLGPISVGFEINHTAPDWASYYRFAYVKHRNNFSFYYAYMSSYVYDSDSNLEDGLAAIYLSPYGTPSSAKFNANPNFTVEIGDYIQTYYVFSSTVIKSYTKYKIYDIRNLIYKEDKQEINGWFLIVKPNDYVFGGDGVIIPNTVGSFNMTISKDNKELSEDIFYEIGDVGLCNSATSGDHVPATGTISDGDAWVRYRTYYTTLLTNPLFSYNAVQVEEYYPSNNIDALLSNIDVPNIKDETYRQQYENTVVWSGKYFQDTKINGLNSFNITNSDGVIVKRVIPEVFGKVKGLEELGNSLVIICEEKVLSTFVGATELTDASGNINVVKSSDVLGYVRPHTEKYGTFLKESILNTGKYIYFYDLFNGAVIRKSANGLFPISGRIDTQQGSYDYKMRGFFKNLSNQLVASLYIDEDYEDVKCFMGYDPYYENIYITFLDRLTDANNVSLIFHEPSNRWVSKYTGYIPTGPKRATMYPFTKKNMFSYLEESGILYQHNLSVNRCELYNEDLSSYVQFVSHALPNQKKVFNSLGIHSTKQYTVDPIEISADSTYRSGFYSKLVDSEFELEEGVYKASFPKNMKTNSVIANNWDRLNGDDMRGYVIKMKLTNSNDDKISLFKVDITSNISK